MAAMLSSTSPTFDPPQLPDISKSIRLLQIFPSEELHNLQCKIVAFADIAEAPSYIAISYTWADRICPIPIRINGQDLRANVYCYSALWHQRLVGVTSWIWTDTICINQDDDEEKSAQVGLMGQIYSCASEVRVCLNGDKLNLEGFERLWSAIECLGTLRTYSRHIEVRCIKQTGSAAKSLLQHEWQLGDEPCVQCTIMNLMVGISLVSTHPYWSRVWIIQEIRRAQHVRVCVGAQIFDLGLLKWQHISKWIATVDTHLRHTCGFDDVPQIGDEPFCLVAASCDHRKISTLDRPPDWIYLLSTVRGACEWGYPQPSHFTVPAQPQQTGSAVGHRYLGASEREVEAALEQTYISARAQWYEVIRGLATWDEDELIPRMCMLKILEPDSGDQDETMYLRDRSSSLPDEELPMILEGLLYNVMVQHTGTKCKDSRDAIFGFLGLTSHCTISVRPDYTRDLTEVISDALARCTAEVMHRTPSNRSWLYHKELYQCIAAFRRTFWKDLAPSKLEIRPTTTITKSKEVREYAKIFIPISHYQYAPVRLDDWNCLKADVPRSISFLVRRFAEICKPIDASTEGYRSKVVQIGHQSAYLANCDVRPRDILAFVFYQEVFNPDNLMQPPGYTALVLRQVGDKELEVVGKAVARSLSTNITIKYFDQSTYPIRGELGRIESWQAEAPKLVGDGTPCHLWPNSGVALSIDVFDYLRLIWTDYQTDTFAQLSAQFTNALRDFPRCIKAERMVNRFDFTLERLEWPTTATSNSTKAWSWEKTDSEAQSSLRDALVNAGWSVEFAAQGVKLVADCHRHENLMKEHHHIHFKYAQGRVSSFIENLYREKRVAESNGTSVESEQSRWY